MHGVRVAHAFETSKRQEREAVREAEEEGDVEVAGRRDRELPGRVEARWQELGVGPLPQVERPGLRRQHVAEAARRPQRREGHSEEAVTLRRRGNLRRRDNMEA